MHEILSYPRGFETYAKCRLFTRGYEYHSQPVLKLKRGDAEVSHIYDLYINRSMQVTGWKFKQDVIQTTKRLFGHMDVWAKNNILQNDALYGVNVDFIIDTIGFIKTGKRSLSLLTWIGLVEECPVSDPQKKQIRNYKQDIIESVGPHWLSDWLSHEDGFNDMLCSINLLFGNVNIPKGFKDSTVN